MTMHAGRSNTTSPIDGDSRRRMSMAKAPRMGSSWAFRAVPMVAFAFSLASFLGLAAPGNAHASDSIWTINSLSTPTDIASSEIVNEVSELVVTGATGGTYELKSDNSELFGEATTTPIAWDASSARVREAIEAGLSVSGIGVTGGELSNGDRRYEITWTGSASARGVFPQPTEAALVGGSVESNQLTSRFTDDQYKSVVTNRSSQPALGPVVLTETFPPQVDPVEARLYASSPLGATLGGEGKCSIEAHAVDCTFEQPEHPILPNLSLYLEVFVGAGFPAFSGQTISELDVSSPVGAAVDSFATGMNSGPTAFGINRLGFQVTRPDGDLDSQAGEHPFGVSVITDLNQSNQPATGNGFLPAGEVKTLDFELPDGFVGDPLATPRCPVVDLGDFEGVIYPHTHCPSDSIVGTLLTEYADGYGGRPFGFPIYNLIPEVGYPAQFGVNVGIAAPIIMDATVVPGPTGYHLRFSAPGILNGQSVSLKNISATFYGVPGDRNGSESSAAFLTSPTRCSSEPSSVLLRATSWEGAPAAAEASAYPSLSGCGRFSGESGFAPSVKVTPSESHADSPTGLQVGIKLPQAQDVSGALATPELRDATVHLPPGLSVDPSSAGGLVACPASGPEGINLEGVELARGTPGGNPASPYDDGLTHAEPGHCPAASTLGTVEVTTPLLEAPLTGHVYLGAPECSPCTGRDAEEGKLVKLYLEVSGSGVIVKLPGSGELSPSGQITGVFKENPQLPFEELDVDFKSGPRAPLTNPPTCGTKTTTSVMEPWSAPETPDAAPASSFEVTSGAGGAACPNGEAGEPNKPSFEAGTLTPIAGSYSPFVLKLSREDGSQRISSIDATLPDGLVGKLAGIPYCSDAAIEAAKSKSGAAEKASSSCPLASEVGTVNVGAGSGPDPYHVQGHAYLAGPYKGAPISLAIITPAVAGPFDLGTVVVRTALFVNEETAQIHAVSDPLPTVLAGIPLDIRSIALDMDRPDFTLNPTSCDPMSILGAADTTAGQTATFSSRFQVGACKALEFKPGLKVSLSGQTKRVGHPALKAVLTYPKGQNANVRRALVNLPSSEFLDQGNLNNTCTKPVLLAGKCPASTVYGKAKAWTPLLEKPLEGPVYLVGGYGYKLPALVAELNGQIRILLVGRVDSGKNHGIRNTFEAVPDAPVSRFVLEMKGGKKYGLLQNSEDICRHRQKAIARFTAQNGKTYDTEPVIQVQCGKGKKKKASSRVGTSHR